MALTPLGRKRRAHPLARRKLDSHDLVRARRRTKDLGHKAHHPQSTRHLRLELTVLVGDAVDVVEVEEHLWPRLDVARRGVRATLWLHERTQRVLLREDVEHGRLDHAALEVVLVGTHLEVNRQRHHLGRTQLVHERSHVSRAKISMP